MSLGSSVGTTLRCFRMWLRPHVAFLGALVEFSGGKRRFDRLSGTFLVTFPTRGSVQHHNYIRSETY